MTVGICRTDADADAARPRGVLARVVQQITEHLHEPDGIGVEVHGRVGQQQVDGVAATVRELGARLDGLVQHVGKVDPFPSQFELVARDPVDIEQVVHQPHHVAGLAIHDVQAAADHRRIRPGAADEFERVPNRRQRAPELVRERGEKIGLAAVGLLQCFFGTLALRDVDGNAADPRGLAPRPGNRKLADERVMQHAILVLEDFHRLDARGALERAPIVFRESRSHVGGKDVRVGPPVQGITRHAERDHRRVVRKNVTPIQVLDPGKARQVLHETAEPFLCGLEGPLGARAIGDVDARPDVARERAVRPLRRDAGVEHPPVFAVGTPQAVFHRERSSRIKGADVGLKAAVQFVRVHVFGPSIADFARPSGGRRTPATAG